MTGWLEDARRVVFSKRKLFEQGLFKPAGHPHRSNAKIFMRNWRFELNKIVIIAEAGVNHNGRLNLALKLCSQAKASGVDIVKFQTFKTEHCITRNVPMAAYQKKNLGTSDSQFEMVKKLELPFEDFLKIKKHCEKRSEEHTSELQSPAMISYAVFCLKKKHS